MSTMRRSACLLLLLTPAVAWASSGMAEADHGTCVTPASAAHGPAPDAPVPPSHSPGHRPTTITPSGGGDDGELLPPRGRMPKWHSFLPGMFR
jgi:hypothetical protein